MGIALGPLRWQRGKAPLERTPGLEAGGHDSGALGLGCQARDDCNGRLCEHLTEVAGQHRQHG